jgi:hypothetical protein
MKRWIFILLALFTGLTYAQTTYQTLFLGNSYTGVNDLPGIVQSLTLAGGDSLIKDANAPGGYTFEAHSTNPTSLALIRARAWDFVVLQEQSQRPSFPQSQVQQDVYPYATQLNDSIKANDSCTVTVFYMTWGRKYGDASNCGFWPPVCTYAGMQYELRQSYLNMANQNNALVAPCGIAWWESILRDSTLELYNPDESHPSYAGSYLNGCVFYATMYRRSPVGLNFYGGLDTATAQFLQQVAHDVVFDSLTQWRIGLDDAVAGFTFTASMNGETNFSNTSTNANAWLWDFGDGATDSVANPVHTYAIPGAYPVTLIVTNGCTSDTVRDTVNVILVNRTDPDLPAMAVYPHPSTGIVHISGFFEKSQRLELQLTDGVGKCLQQYIIFPQSGRFEKTLDLSVLPKGLYLLSVVDAAGTRATFRLVLE